MATKKTATVVTKVKDLAGQGKTIKFIRAFLTLEGYSDAAASDVLKEAGIAGKKRGFADSYYAWLSAEERTKEAAEEYILGAGEYGETSENVKNHLSHYLNIHALTVTIWESK